jgi:hypothetical protein
VDQEVAKTLGELELKLQQLERELTSIGPGDATSGYPDGQADTSVHPPGPADASHHPPGQADTSVHPADASIHSQEPADISSGPAGPLAAQGAGRASTTQSQPSGRLVDEAVEAGTSESTLAEDEDGFGGPVVFGGEEVPAQGGATIGQPWTTDVRETAYGEIPRPPTLPSGQLPGPPLPPPAPPPQPPSTTPPGPPPPETPPAPAPQPDPQPIDRAELVRFKQRLERTMTDLSDELSRLLLPKPPT